MRVDRQQLEERTTAEQVEIVRVEMVVIGETVAGRARPDPSVLDARQAALVEGHGASGGLSRAHHAIVSMDEHRQGEHRRQEPPP